MRGISFEEAWGSEEYKDAVIEEALRDLGYLIEPKYLFPVMVRQDENNNFDIEYLQAAINSIMESTMGLDYDEDFRIFAHSSTATVLRTVHMLTKYGRYTPPEGQPVYITHMSRSLHDTPVDKNWPDIIKPAHDGLEVVFRAPV